MRKEKVAILGGSRGLGAALVKNLKARGHEVLSISRKGQDLVEEGLEVFNCDFSQKTQWPALIEKLNQSRAQALIYCAGGGPYGKFGDKLWKDQEWSLAVTFETPAYLAWEVCRTQALPLIKTLIVIGSAVAESSPDPQAAMYCASKHGLKGLLGSLQKEYPDRALHLYSAPYMDTDLLPSGAWPRREIGLVKDPADVAQDLVNSLLG